MIKIAESEQNLRNCFTVMVQLRPHLDVDSFLERVALQFTSGYRVVYLATDDKVVAVAGIRLSRNLAWGKFLYIDDLITDAAERSKGYGKQLLDWCIAHARQNNCQQLHLDSGVQRKDAHRFYEREGMTFTGHHYAIEF